METVKEIMERLEKVERREPTEDDWTNHDWMNFWVDVKRELLAQGRERVKAKLCGEEYDVTVKYLDDMVFETYEFCDGTHCVDGDDCKTVEFLE